MMIGQVLREARKLAGIKQGELAAIVGISIWTMNRVEMGRQEFKEEWLGRLPDPVRGAVAKELVHRQQQRLRAAQNAARAS